MILKENYIPVQTKTVLYSGVTALYRGVVQYCTIQNSKYNTKPCNTVPYPCINQN